MSTQEAIDFVFSVLNVEFEFSLCDPGGLDEPGGQLHDIFDTSVRVDTHPSPPMFQGAVLMTWNSIFEMNGLTDEACVEETAVHVAIMT